MQITYKNLRDDAFNMAMKKLSSKPFRDQKLAWRIAKIVNALQKEAETAQSLLNKIVETYAEKDESGNLKQPEGLPPGSYRVAENLADYQKAMKDFEALPIDLPGNKFTFKDLEPVELSPEDLISLEPMLEGEPA